MARTRISTTVDDGLLSRARDARRGSTDAAMLDEALDALLAKERRAEIDASYEAYDRIPLDAPDAWGDLASFLEALDRS